MKEKKQPLIVIAGPTASGKTELGIRLAKELNGEIISGDSMQVYKFLDIGTAKTNVKEMKGVPHHLIDIINPKDEYNVQIFQKMAKDKINDIYSRGKIPILVGGTGLYIDALVYHYNFINENKDKEIREKLWFLYNTSGNEILIEQLKEKDPKALDLIDPSNTKRLIRALEIFEKNNIKYSELERNSKVDKESPFHVFYYVITMNRDELYDRINRRVDRMFENGWLEEVEHLVKNRIALPEYRSMQGLGYRQIIDYLNGTLSYDECKNKIKQNTRKFAKRQLTWFRKNKDIIWIDKDKKNTEEVFSDVINFVKRNI